jgi:hypothetical protein
MRGNKLIYVMLPLRFKDEC